MYILVKGTITVPNTGAAAAHNNRNKKVIFTNCVPFTDCLSEIKNKEIDHAKDEPFIDGNGIIIDAPDAPDNASFKYKQKITCQTRNDGTKNVQIMVPLEHLRNF